MSNVRLHEQMEEEKDKDENFLGKKKKNRVFLPHRLGFFAPLIFDLSPFLQ